VKSFKKVGIFVVVMLGLVCSAVAQSNIVRGKIYDERLQPLPYAQIFVKDQPQYATSSNDTGAFELSFPTGRFEIIAKLPGYKTSSTVVIVAKQEIGNVRILMAKDEKTLAELKVTGIKKDKSEEIVRQLIRRKEELMAPVKSYNATLYIKAVTENMDSFKVAKHKKLSDSARTADSLAYYKYAIGRNSITEIITNLDVQMPNKTKETRLGVSSKGSTQNLFYLRTTDGNFNFYNNLVQVQALSEVSFLSPLSYSGLVAYKYKMLSIVEQDGRNVYRIRVTPSKTGNSLVQGEIFIQDSTFALIKTILRFPAHQTPEYKEFEIEQDFDNYGTNEKSAWLLSEQNFRYVTISNPRNKNSTKVVYKNYTLDTLFPPKHFGEELSSTAAEAYERDSTFWTTQRAEPLSSSEIKLIAFKDSIYNETHSQKFYDSVDKITNKITAAKIIYEGITKYKRTSERQIFINPLLAIFQPVNLGGYRFGLRGNYTRRFPNYHRLNVYTQASYGPLNKDLLGEMKVYYRYNAFKQTFMELDFGKRNGTLVQNDAAINYLSRSLYYRNRNLNIAYGTEIVNGLYVRVRAEFAHRSSLNNYKLSSGFLDSILAKLKIPLYGNNNTPVPFDAYNVLYGSINVRYVHRQQYIREPRQKLVLGSKYPELSLSYRKGISGVLGSTVDFDYIQLGASKEQNLGTLGISRISATYGNFLRKKRLEIPDNKWVVRGQLYAFFNPETSFQALDSTVAINKGYAELHYYHQFNGALINKIPYSKKLKLFESAGSAILYMPERNLKYIEFFAGIDKQFKALGQQWRIGVYAVSAFANSYSRPLQWKFGIKHYDEYSNRWE
jgi:hypothetical protein